MKENIILDKSYEFAKSVVLFSYNMQTQKKEYILSKQLLRSGTSIGANIEEAVGGFCKKNLDLKCRSPIRRLENADIGLG
jgi:four helix bundle protein